MRLELLPNELQQLIYFEAIKDGWSWGGDLYTTRQLVRLTPLVRANLLIGAKVYGDWKQKCMVEAEIRSAPGAGP